MTVANAMQFAGFLIATVSVSSVIGIQVDRLYTRLQLGEFDFD